MIVLPEHVEAILTSTAEEKADRAAMTQRSKTEEQNFTVAAGGACLTSAATADSSPDCGSRTSAPAGLRQDVTVLPLDTGAFFSGSVREAEQKLSPDRSEDEVRRSEGIRPSLSKMWDSFSRGSGIAQVVRSSCADMKPPESTSTESTTTMHQKGGGYHSLILGVLLAGGTSAALSLVNVIIKRLETVSALEVLTFMAFGVFIGILPAATEEVQPFGPRRAQPLLFVRTVLSLASAALRLSSLSYLTIADSSIMTSLTPLMVGVTATLFLSEPCHWTQSVAMALSIVGITLVGKPPFLSAATSTTTKTQYIGIAYGLSHSVLNGVTTVCIRATKGVSRSVVVFHYGCLSMLLVSIVSIAMGRLKVFYDGSQIGYLLLISHLTFALQMFLSKALQVESASFVTIVKTSSDVIFGYIMQATFLNVYPDVFSITGGSLILSGVLIIGLRKIAQAADPDSKFRSRLRFLL